MQTLDIVHCMFVLHCFYTPCTDLCSILLVVCYNLYFWLNLNVLNLIRYGIILKNMKNDSVIVTNSNTTLNIFCHTLYHYILKSKSSKTIYFLKAESKLFYKMTLILRCVIILTNAMSCHQYHKTLHFSWCYPLYFLTHHVYQLNLGRFIFFEVSALRKFILLLVCDMYFSSYIGSNAKKWQNP